MHPETVSSSKHLIPMTSRLLQVLWFVSLLLVVIGSLLPASSPVIRAVGRLPVSQKVLHFCAYTWLALLALLAIRRRSLALLVALSIILLGVALEFGQKLAPGRGFEVRDMFINGAGVLTGMVIGIFSRHIGPAVSRS
jgi:VanZ family protein